MPSLGDQLLNDMNVEGVIADLQSKSRSSRPKPAESLSLESSIASSADLQSDVQSDAGSVSVISSMTNEPLEPSSAHPTESSSSWVDQFSATQQSQSESRSSRGASPIRSAVVPESPHSSGASLSDSVATTESIENPGNSIEPQPVIPEILLPDPSTVVSTKSKAELWNEVKILSKFYRSYLALAVIS